MSPPMPPDPATREKTRNEIVKVFAQIKKGQDYITLQQHVVEMEDKIFKDCGSTDELYKKTIQDTLLKARGPMLVEWFNVNRRYIAQFLQRKFLSATLCPEIVTLLSSAALPNTWNTKQLQELDAVKAALPKAAAAYKASAIPSVAEALQSIVSTLDQACHVIEQALLSTPFQRKADDVASAEERLFCRSLSVNRLHDIVTIVSNFLTPFFISLRENAKGDATVCALCSQSSSAHDQRSLHAISHSLSQKFDWNDSVPRGTEMQQDKEYSRCCKVDAGMHEDASAAEVLCANALRRLLWLNNCVLVESAAASPQCSIALFVEQHEAHFVVLNSWLRDLLALLRRSVIPNVSKISSSGKSIGKSVGSSECSKEELSRDNKSAPPSNSQNLNFRFSEKRALNISNYKCPSQKKRLKSSSPSLSESIDSSTPLLTLSDMLTALHKVYNVRLFPIDSISSPATSLGSLQYLQLDVPVEKLLNELDTSFPSAFVSVGKFCRVDITLDEQRMPLQAIINASSGAVPSYDRFSGGSKNPCAFSGTRDLPLVYRRPDSIALLPLYQKMNAALSSERSKLDLPMRMFNSSADQLDTFFKLLSGLLSYFDLSISSSDDTTSSGNVASDEVNKNGDNFNCYPQERPGQALVSRVHVSVQSGQVSVSCAAAVVSS